ncbi:MAG: BTAD domain-containing putative transcriptional regulator [Actinomycetota bacterium]
MRVSILGPLGVRTDDADLDVGGAKQQLVLAALVLARGKIVSTDRLVELIWGAHPPSKPYVTLRAYISHLRRILEPEQTAGRRSSVLVTRSPGYALQIDLSAVDAFEFEERLTTARDLLDQRRVEEATTEVEAAMNLWRSEDLSDSPLDSFGAERDRLLELRQHASILWFDCRLASGHHAESIPDLRLLVEADPLRERPRAQLMLALYRAGRPAEALEVYQAGYRASVEATGLDPAPSLKELEARILRNDPDLDWVAPGAVSPTAAVVGRSIEARELLDALAAPNGELVLITGEAGIGKSHLLDFLATQAGAAGLTVAWGVGHPGHRSLTLAPWRAILSGLLTVIDDDLLRALGRRRGAELAHLLPEITERVGIEPTPTGDETSLHDAVADLLRRLMARTALVLCCDDVHWYDAASVRLLSYIARTLKGQPGLVAVAWRDGDFETPETADAVADLVTVAGRRRLALAGLDDDAVAELWTQELGDAPGAGTAERLRRRTGGNPLFISELLRSRRQSNALQPTATIRDLISAQVAGLPSGSEELLTICALCPDGATEGLLATVSGLADADLDACLSALVANRLVVEVTSTFPAFTVRHSVIAECLTERLTLPARARYHNLIAEALKRQQIPMGRLAHHFLVGGAAAEPVTAATAALEAARYSAGLHDHPGAIDLIERGLVALDRADDDLLRGELLVLLAQQRKHQEHYTQAHAAALEGFRLGRRGGDVNLMMGAALAYCGQTSVDVHYGSQWLGYWHPPGPALDMLAECMEKLEPGSSIMALCRVAYAAQLFGEFQDPEDARFHLDLALEEARALDDPTLLSSLLHYRTMALQRELGTEERRKEIDEGLSLVDTGESPHREIVARRDLAILALDDRDLDAARHQIELAHKAARRADDPIMTMLTVSMDIALDLYQGELDGAERALHDSLGRFERMGSAALDVFGIQLAVLGRERGSHGQVADMLRWKLSGYPGPAYALPLAVVLAEQGETGQAQELLDQFRAPAPVLAGESVLQFMTLSFAADLAVALDDRALAVDVYEHLAPAEGRTVAMFSGIALYGSGSLYLGRLATVLDRLDEAERHLDEAAAHHRAHESRPYLLRTALARAEVAARRGDADAAEALVAAQEAEAEELGMAWLPTWTRRLCAHLSEPDDR